MLLTSIFLITSLTCVSESAKILGIFPNSGYSQYILGSALMKALAERGHEVTVISPFSLKTPVPNYRDVTTQVGRKGVLDAAMLFNLESLDFVNNIIVFHNYLCLPLTKGTLEDEEVQKLLRSNTQFDLVISEQFGNEAHMGFAYHYKTPLVLFSSLGANEWTNPKVGNPGPFSYVPMVYSDYTGDMNFWQRLRNSAAGLFDLLYHDFIVLPKHNELLQKHFPGAPHINELIKNISLILLNSHPAMNSPVPHVPNMIEIGGFHVSPKKLPKDLQEFLDSAKDGAIFFSMGSNLRSRDLSKEKVDAILRVFGKLKQKVLWKWEDENLPGKPKNVKIGKWLPQQDVLVHPNLRVFISHGGLLSTTETVYAGVPIIGIPIYGDQKMNIEIAIAGGYALKIPFQELTEKNLEWTLNEILTNTSYIKTAQKRSRILRDQPSKPIDTAVFWIEYVLRHQGATHLRSAALNLTWYQYFLLDVCAFVMGVIFVIVILVKVALRKLFKSKEAKPSKKEKKH